MFGPSKKDKKINQLKSDLGNCRFRFDKLTDEVVEALIVLGWKYPVCTGDFSMPSSNDGILFWANRAMETIATLKASCEEVNDTYMNWTPDRLDELPESIRDYINKRDAEELVLRAVDDLPDNDVDLFENEVEVALEEYITPMPTCDCPSDYFCQNCTSIKLGQSI